MYYFLDVDGVLNKEADWDKPFTVNPDCLSCFRKLLSYDKHPFIVLSSTWRANLDIISSYITVEDVTPNTGGRKTRQEEIEYYIRRNNIQNYLILDDDESLFPEKEKIDIFFTDYKKGLTDSDVKQIVKKYL
ncbi:MAG: HAD domain-containing protein [Lachnospiraceae bacterium]|nr:HAD domain-containing protein [Lachnospiraceae bacterium]